MTSPPQRVGTSDTKSAAEPRPTPGAGEWYTPTGPCASEGLMLSLLLGSHHLEIYNDDRM